MNHDNYPSPIPFQAAQEALKQLILSGYLAARSANKYIFEDNDGAALAYLSQSRSYFLSAKTLYTLDLDLGHVEFEDLFDKFQIFDDELLSNFATNHSHQWTDIEFNALLDALNSLNGLFGFENDYFQK